MNFEELDAKARLRVIAEAVEGFSKSKRLARALECRKYYATENPDIAERRKVYAGVNVVEDAETPVNTLQAVAKENQFAANEKVSSSFFRDITDAKVQYLAGEGADINALDDSGADTITRITDAIGMNQLKRIEQEGLTEALIYRFGYTYMNVVNGAIHLENVPYTEVIPFKDRRDNLEAVIRWYGRGEKEYAEYHTASMIFYFERDAKEANAEWEAAGEQPQIITTIHYGDGSSEVTGGKGWARLPWFEMRHNSTGTSSLTNAAKSMIRVYDVTISDFANNLIDVQDVFINLKDSYGSGMDWGEQLELLKTFKVGEGVNGVTTVDVPYMARQTLLDMLKASIYESLRGVDVGRIARGQLTNTAIRALYSDIDLWADQAEWYIGDWVREIMGTVADYLGVTLPPYDVRFTRRAIFDEVEQMQAVAAQKGVISDKTLFENHPLVKDAQAELLRVEEQDAGAAYMGEV